MLTFVVDEAHINCLINYASRHNVRVFHGNPRVMFKVLGNEQKAAEMLLYENMRIISYRYCDHNAINIAYDQNVLPVLTAIEALQAAESLRRQCLHPDFKGSMASKLIKAIIKDAIPRLEGLVIWDDQD